MLLALFIQGVQCLDILAICVECTDKIRRFLILIVYAQTDFCTTLRLLRILLCALFERVRRIFADAMHGCQIVLCRAVNIRNRLISSIFQRFEADSCLFAVQFVNRHIFEYVEHVERLQPFNCRFDCFRRLLNRRISPAKLLLQIVVLLIYPLNIRLYRSIMKNVGIDFVQCVPETRAILFKLLHSLCGI